MLKLIFIIFSLNFSVRAGTNPQDSDSAFKKFRGFTDQWKLVTVRYRADTGEQRFTYANDLAHQVLLKNSTDYPDGAVFGKVGMSTQEDPAFLSSKVPSGIARIQFMIRDRKKYAATGGWGYSLYDDNGVNLLAQAKTDTHACYACHKIVTDRGQVFSQPVNFSSLGSKLSLGGKLGDRIKFETRTFESLPKFIRDRISPATSVRSLTGDIQKNIFVGTLDEIRPELYAEAEKSGFPSMILSDDEIFFTVVIPSGFSKDKSSEKCFAPKAAFSVLWGGGSKGDLIRLFVCK